ncbi:hypothetical protein [Dinoroseobacter sp. S375]|uniref:hypothetical protein n=1 Tax=Dinoroseobacter sp. S375 TaxID=3415136 RepID=UPI003C7B513F
MPREIRIYRSTPFDPLAQTLLIPPKSRTRPDMSDVTGPNGYFYLAARDEVGLGCIALRNMGSFGLVSAFRFVAAEARGSLPDILIEQVETLARSLRLRVIRAWVDRMHPIQAEALRRNQYIASSEELGSDELVLYERELQRAPHRMSDPVLKGPPIFPKR